MYLSNKYTTWYYNIINNALTRQTIDGYTEKHHIIPKSLGGSDSLNNLVRLTAREHFVCHQLLKEMTTGKHKMKMANALWRMCCGGDRGYKISSKTYNQLRELHSINISNMLIDAYKTGERKSRLGIKKNKPMSEEAKEKLRATRAKNAKPAWNKGIPRTPEEKMLISERRKAGSALKPVWNLGIPHSELTKEKIRNAIKNRKNKKCPHCSKEVSPANYARWHGDNCRSKH